MNSAKTNVSVYTLNDWINVFLMARSTRGENKGSYNVKQLGFSEIIDLKSLAAIIIKNRSIDNEGKRVNWLKIQVMCYEKTNPGVILFNTWTQNSRVQQPVTYFRG